MDGTGAIGTRHLCLIAQMQIGETMAKGYEFVLDPKKRAIIKECPYYYFGECDLEFHHEKICPSEKCICADTFGYKRGEKMAGKMTSREICKLLGIIVGGTEPVADTAIDDVVNENLKTLIDIGDWVLDGLMYAAEHRKDPYDSSRTIGERAYACMLEWKDWLAEKEKDLA